MEDIRYLDDVSSLTMDADKCIGCGLCTQVCPHNVFELRQGKAFIIDYNACMECGACVNNCPSGALLVSPGVG